MESLLELFGGAGARLLADVLFHSLWQDLAIGALVGILHLVFRDRGADARYATACAGLGLVVLAPIATGIFLLAEVPSSPVHVATEPAAAGPIRVAAEPVPPHTDVPLVDTLEFRRTDWQAWLLLGWCLGVAGCGTFHVLGFAHARRWARAGTSPAPEPLARCFRRLSTTMGIARCRLAVSRIVRTPSVIGHLAPVVLLPARAVTGLSMAQLEALLAHELAHVRRHDYLVNLLQVAVETLFFFHPAVWWISHRVRIEREHCCDDDAVARCGDAMTYASALATMEELRGRALAMAISGQALLPRIRRVLGVAGPKCPPARGILPGSLTSLATAATLVCCAAWQRQDASLPDRAEFAKKMARIEAGMTRARVIAILGEPSDVVTRRDKIIHTTRTKEVLGWGNGKNRKRYVRDGVVQMRTTNGTHLTCPTLGCVYIDVDDKVQFVYGAKPYKPVGIEESRLRELLEWLDVVPPPSLGPYTPRPAVDAINALLPLGKTKALAVIDELTRVNVICSEDAGKQRVSVDLVGDITLKQLFEAIGEDGDLDTIIRALRK